MEEKNILYDKIYAFSIRIVRLSQYLSNEKKEYVLNKQIIRSGTAICALISESKFAQSRADFLNKLMIALKEANETQYWINLLHDTEYISKPMHHSLLKDNKELVGLLVSITKTLKNKSI
ncbi:four helix bundle protein [Sulfurovum riftiae]|uniref:Four helix bundle protein n=1 Tax=Sulfurovum riftiae TaxID=1630136 RepID=A0A151CF61_9BACT|nr:four helix bundle protein [Sulfurovum riftiae]KYJ86168.1 four helix bundle protein [Sulfurovum riftiae]